MRSSRTHCRAIGVLNVIGKDAVRLHAASSPRMMIAEKLGMRCPYRQSKLDEADSGPPAGHVRGLSAPGPVLYAEKEQADGAAATSAAIRWALPRRLPPSTRRICMGASVSGLHGFNKACGEESAAKHRRCHRRLHVHALRHDRPDQHCLQRVNFDRHHPRQLHHRHDRPPAEPDDGLTTSRATPARRSIWKRCAMPSASGACRSSTRMIWRPATRRSRRSWQQTSRRSLSPAVRARCSNTSSTPGPIEAKPEKCVGCKSCMKHRLSGHQRDGRQSCRSTTPCAWAAACAASCAIRARWAT